MYKYTLAFLKRDDEILMLNRYHAPWMGSWNGVGGKVLKGEDIVSSIIREIYEETNIKVTKDDLVDKGVVTWNDVHEFSSGLHVFLVNLSNDFIYETPKIIDEGILQFKKIDWILNEENTGVCSNIFYFLKDVLYSDTRYNHYCTFDGNNLVSVKKNKL